MAFKKVHHLVEPQDAAYWSSWVVHYEGQMTPEWCYSEDVDVLKLQTELLQQGFTQDQLNLIEAYGNTCRDQGYASCERNQVVD